MKLIAQSLFAAAALIAAAAHAEGLYVGGSVGGSHYKDREIGGYPLSDHADTGLKLYGGYSFNPNIALEAGYANLGKFRSSAGDVKADGYFLDAVGTLPLGYNFSALGRVGVFNGKLEADGIGNDRGTSYKVGLGVQYDIAKNISVRTEWERYRFDALGSKPDADLYSVGVNYKF
ncbi:hypothetical protein BH11PSE8_BH11PSE8_39620 [soil metagenome]